MHLVEQCIAGRPALCELVVETERAPLAGAHLMELENLHAVYGVKGRDEVGKVRNVIQVIGKTWNQDGTYPQAFAIN